MKLEVKSKSIILLLCSILLIITGCTDSATDEADLVKRTDKRELTIFAAAQLTDVFKELEQIFEQKNGAEVTINFAGSQVARTQIEQGAPADIFASADLSHMKALQEKNLVGEERLFSHNTLIVILPTTNPARLQSLEDLAEKQYRLIVGGENVPIGRYTRQFLEQANGKLGVDFKEKVLSNVVSLETNTRQVAGKITLGEGDAGVVYVTDISPSIENKLRTIEIPSDINVISENVLAITSNAREPELAQQWIDFVLSAEGQEIMAKYKFGKVK